MIHVSRIGNSIFFIGLVLLVTAAIVWDASDGEASPIALAIALVGLLLMGVGGWMWNKPDPNADPNRPIPLSQQSAKAKMLAAIPGAIAVYVFGLPGNEDIVARTIGYALLAYAMAGAVEAVIDRKFPNAKAKWDGLATWKKLSISTVVIVASFFLFAYAMMGIARLDG